MRPVDVSEILDLKTYEAVREKMRADMLDRKKARRIAVGGHMSLLFENRETVRYQMQEMIRIERLVKPEEIRQEVETYNELVPGDGELSATLLIEYPDERERDAQLTALRGLEAGAIRLQVGRVPAVPPTFDSRQLGSDRISSVHYLKFALPPDARAAFRREGLAGNVRFVVDHPAYRAEAVLLPEQVLALAADLEAA